MATVTFSDAAPSDITDAVHFAFANKDFDLTPGSNFDTEDADLIDGARTHPWLNVEIEVPEQEAAPERDENDPHQNPAADHLNALASPEVVQAAAERNEAIVNATTPVTDTAAAQVQTTSQGPQPTPPQPEQAVAPAPTTGESS